MVGAWQAWLQRLNPDAYGRHQPLVLINGLAEQPESWFRNHRYWSKYFDVHMPNVLVYSGAVLQQRMEQDLPISVDFLVDQLHTYLGSFVQAPPYHLVASSLGGKVAIEYAARYPELVNRIVLICPSGLGDAERLPIVQGVRRNDMKALVESVFHNPSKVDPGLLAYYNRQMTSRQWRLALLKTVRATSGHSVQDRLSEVHQQTLLISGEQDRIVDSRHAAQAVRLLPNGHYVSIPQCGHAPQLEKPWLINRLVTHFLSSPTPTIRPRFSQLLLARPNTIL